VSALGWQGRFFFARRNQFSHGATSSTFFNVLMRGSGLALDGLPANDSLHPR
jgi:hypothetical protein